MIHDSLLFIHYSSLITHHHHHHHSSRAQCPMTQCPQSHHIMDNGDTMTTVTGASPMTVPVCSGTQKDVESSRRPSRVSESSESSRVESKRSDGAQHRESRAREPASSRASKARVSSLPMPASRSQAREARRPDHLERSPNTLLIAIARQASVGKA